MIHSAERARPPVACLAATLTVLLLTNGCFLSRGDADANAIQVARETLQSELESLKKRNDGSSFHSTMIRSLEDGIAKLSRTSDGPLEGPLVVEAGINADPGDPSGRR